MFDASLVAGKHSNIYSECMEKSGVNYMLDNLRKVDILQLSNFFRSKRKGIQQKMHMLPLKVERWGLDEKPQILV